MTVRLPKCIIKKDDAPLLVLLLCLCNPFKELFSVCASAAGICPVRAKASAKVGTFSETKNIFKEYFQENTKVFRFYDKTIRKDTAIPYYIIYRETGKWEMGIVEIVEIVEKSKLIEFAG